MSIFKSIEPRGMLYEHDLKVCSQICHEMGFVFSDKPVNRLEKSRVCWRNMKIFSENHTNQDQRIINFYRTMRGKKGSDFKNLGEFINYVLEVIGDIPPHLILALTDPDKPFAEGNVSLKYRWEAHMDTSRRSLLTSKNYLRLAGIYKYSKIAPRDLWIPANILNAGSKKEIKKEQWQNMYEVINYRLWHFV